MLLAIDTSVGTSVAVVDRDLGVLAERSSADPRLHAEVVGPFIAAVLAEASVEVTALSGVAVGMGPGPFTGLRVGIAAAQAFALGAGIPVVRVVSHDAIAFARFATRAQSPLRPPERLLVVTDARRREVYWSGYSGASVSGLPDRVLGPALDKPAQLPDALRASGVEGFADPRVDAFERLDASEVSAGALGMLAETMYTERARLAGSEPLYLRSPDVTPPAARKRVG